MGDIGPTRQRYEVLALPTVTVPAGDAAPARQDCAGPRAGSPDRGADAAGASEPAN